MIEQEQIDSGLDSQYSTTLIDKAYHLISTHATKSEVASWTRKRKLLEKLIVDQVRPMEQKLMEITLELQPLYDEIQQSRTEMVRTCIHPKDLIVHDETTNTFICKFCDKRMNIVGLADYE